MSNATPAGLTRYARSMRTRYSGKCHFCGDATVPNNDYAAQTGSCWIGVCIPCAESMVAQVRGAYRRLVSLSKAETTTSDMLAAASIQMPSHDKLAAAMADGASDTIAFDVLIALLSAVPCFTPADPIKDALQAVADNSNATPKHRQVAAGMVENIAKWGKLTDNQRSYAESIIASYSSTGTPVADTTPTVKVPAGRYALVVDGTLKFYKVDAPTSGKWAGYTFVKVQAGDDHYPVKGAAGKAVLALIGADVAGAAGRYGQEMRHCGFCKRSLTRKYSRGIGYGPDCASQHGLPFDHKAYAASEEVAD